MAGTKELIATRVAYLGAEFGAEPAALYQGDRYSWAYVATVKAFLDDALVDVDSSATVALVLRQRPNCLAATVALWAQGRCVTLVSPIRPDQSLADELRALAPAVVVADTEDWARAGFAEVSASAIGVELPLSATTPLRLRLSGGAFGASRVATPAAHAVTITTSGTTGPPKRYALSWDDLRPAGAVRDPSADRGVIINALPLFSIGGVRAMATTIFGGRPIALMDRFDVVEWAGMIRDYRPRRAGAPPAVLRMVLDANIPADWLSSVKSLYTASAPLPMPLADEFEATYGFPVVQGYGATEFLGGVTGWPGDLHERSGAAKRGSVGRALPGIALRVVDPATREPLAHNEVGNLEVDSPYRVHGVPDGWVPTNDLARIDEDGFVWIIGRSDDVIIRGGFKVSLPEVEAALLQHPHVVEACVLGLADDRVGEVPAALVVTDRGEAPDEAQLIDFVREQLPPYMVPTLVVRQDAMPLNSMLKRDRPVIAALLAAELETRMQTA